jgi:hypothetical protein
VLNAAAAVAGCSRDPLPPPLPSLQDKSNPKAWDKPEDMTVVPPEAALQRTAVQDIQIFFGIGGSSSSGAAVQ